MFKKSISIAIIILCLGIIGCTETNEPSFNKSSFETELNKSSFDGTYTVVTVLEKPIDYWQNNEPWIMKLVYVDENGKIDKAFFNGYGELTVTKQQEHGAYFELDEKYYPSQFLFITSSVLGDTITGAYSFGGELIGALAVDFVAVKQ
jgi:hypothetical protein